MSKPDLKPVKERVASTPTPEEIKAFIQADKAVREQRALQRIQQILTEERCTMAPMMVLTHGNVTAKIDVTAQE